MSYPMDARPMTKVERTKFNRAAHERKMRNELVAKHGEELGNFHYWLRLMGIRGTQLYREEDDLRLIREVSLALQNIYNRYSA